MIIEVWLEVIYEKLNKIQYTEFNVNNVRNIANKQTANVNS